MGKLTEMIERPERPGGDKEDPSLAATEKESKGWVSPRYARARSFQLDPEVLTANRCIALSTNVPEGEAYRLLRTRILHRALEKGGNTLMVTSAVPGEGKTLTAINFAFTMAREYEKTVLLVDCDLRKQNVSRVLGIPSEKGLVDYFQGNCSIEDLILWPGVEKMTLISGGKTLDESSEVLGSPGMKDVVAEMKRRYPDRFVIFDVPPVLRTADALAFAPLIDHVVMVVQAGKTPLPDVKKAMEMLPREKILGIVLNRHDEGQIKYYYGDGYHSPTPPKKQPGPQIRPSSREEEEQTTPEIRKETEREPSPSRVKEKDGTPVLRKILLGSILSAAILAAIFYYVPWDKPGSIPPAEIKYSFPAEVSSGAVAPDPKSAFSSPPQPRKGDEETSPAGSSSPPVSLEPASSEKESPAASATPPKEIQAVKSKDPGTAVKGGRIAKASALPKKDFFAIKIMAVRDPQKAKEFMNSQKKKGFDLHARAATIKDQGSWYQIFLGHFESQEEALRFLTEKKIRQVYPGSIIVKLTPNKIK